MPRLGHKKSRLGCRQCKARHVKCDELKPCSNCARHGVPCSLVTWDPNTPQPSSLAAGSAATTPRRTNQSSPSERPIAVRSDPHIDAMPLDIASSASATPPSRVDSHTSQHAAISEGSSPESQADQYLFLSRFIHRNEIPQADLWLRDLELLHFWTTEAHQELTHRSDICHMWQVEAPKYAVSHPYLMHEMLAFAAFSKADKEQQQELRHEYYAFGVHHQDCAIRGLRKNIAATAPQEAAAIVATATLLTLSVFASSGFEAEHNLSAIPPCAIEGLLNCFYLMQGMGNVMALAQAAIVDSFLGPLVRDPSEVTPSQPLLLELLQQTPALVGFIRNKHDLPESERATYLATVAHFDPALSISLPPKVDNRELRFLFFWPLHISADFMGLLQQRRPGALVILMYYSTVLLAAEPRYWFMKNWGQRVLKACHESIDQTWVPAIQWPLSFLNSNATFDLFANLMRRQNSAATPGGVLYPQRPAPDMAYRQTHPGHTVPTEMTNHSSPEHNFVVTLAEQDKTPKVHMGNNTVDHDV
ncbi:hypothetical protein COCC4DRAFT_143142 [Bipolaris maydis ATCC 48331]|uniref:Zn(2)-C6 fungal-type domain-containing protein n=2 Tax=Cochliobolus heterostrophus TaxID=5016 RepID=M2UIU4_COCH5|nr:uncharacterized protein COCC4DRAFT_143142 [Bipolaris maydis ATCC 48331]EMD87913.1 hypothetical protein COCHEDRAFT_1183005 [Bipolaris maydis C5]KAJ5024196.1 hypothetical protein J3E73DRAFT_398524 [Bipolaris maydis]ENI03427.1 hypothetical protein COCC4DRAFT_143142 [Bipolaris maydis ATCC 48331]KAJ5057591.1 hypothetical protein J3E74DRAFT_437922 [Bipolaris maydis]KAJ6194842.1 hypothetical protein J3E72DRAFT_403602 [Bipolaris maydis]